MNPFQWITISGLGLLALLEVRAFLKNRQPIHVFREFVWLAAVLMILFPGLTTRMADWLGIGRGTDLVFYAFMLLATGAFFHFYGRIYVMRRDIVELARREALHTATPGEGLQRPAHPATIASRNEGGER
ncbi:hypothetical protein FF011L_04570 [Roseimaritima multifibrata]|uniref:DUF2304 domain-containing protein n=1 Tax=Roseimaritima multifibrata TaxID=1930274 RepID=A0A517MA30_9BACT|nr:DUF2304 domain-containing protein [Roseimaritima multifibrata]QDS91724.1 hypothetical protein FF011L_04570 [Roseimaritima multifibrata]